MAAPCADIHIGVGFSVARSDKTGQCQSLDGWNELTDGFHAFFVYVRRVTYTYLFILNYLFMRNQLFFKGLLAAALLLPGIGASAYDFEYEGLYYNILSESERTVEVTWPETDGVRGSYAELTDVVIPETVTFGNVEYTVKAVGDFAFMQSSITSIKLPSQVTKIEMNALYLCENLTNVEMSKVDSIGEAAFAYCEKLESIDLGESLVYIGPCVFWSCSSLNTIDLPSTVEHFSSYPTGTLAGCSSLTAVNVDENNENYASVDGVLYSKDLTVLIACPPAYEKETLSIPEGAEMIYAGAIYDCTNLKEINVPSTVEYIGDEAIYICSGLTAVNVDENNNYYASVDGALYTKDLRTLMLCPAAKETFVTLDETETILEGAFCRCYNLTQIELSKNVEELENVNNQPFHQCTNLREIKVSEDNPFYASADGILYTKDFSTLYACPPGIDNVEILDGVKSIGRLAFGSCDKIEILVIPNSVTEIGERAIDSDCNNLTTIECHAVNPPTVENDRFYYDIYTNVTLKVPTGCKEAYASTEPWSNFVNIEEMTATGIGGVEAGDVVISADGGMLTVSGLADGCTVEVYTLDGKQVYGGKGGSIGGLGSGVYVVKAGGKTVKVVL